MYHRNFAGLVMGAPLFLFRLHDMGPILSMPKHSVGRGERSAARPKIHGFSCDALREMRRVNGVGSSHRRKRAQAALARSASRRKAELAAENRINEMRYDIERAEAGLRPVKPRKRAAPKAKAV